MKNANTNNAEKIILDLCGGTGSWSKPYREAGYTVHVITLPDYSVTNVMMLKGSVVFLYRDEQTPSRQSLVIDFADIYGVLAAPPCTQFSRARTTAKTPRDLKGAMSVVRACTTIVENARMAEGSTLKFWALENPMSMLRQLLGNPPHSFRGWEWGDDHVKFTDLWGYYTMPKPKIKQAPDFDRKRWAAPKCPAEYRHLKLDRAAIRAITPPNFARAFYEANK